MLDAPVSGSVPQVQSGTLTIMVGGDEDAYRRVEPILRELGTPTTSARTARASRSSSRSTSASPSRCSPSPKGCCWPSGRASTAQRALDVMEESPIGSPMLRARASIILDPPEEAWFDLGFMHKDIELALDAARRLEIPLPTAERADEVLEQRGSSRLRAARPRRAVPGARRDRNRRPVERMTTRAIGGVCTVRHHGDALAARGGEGGWAAVPPARPSSDRVSSAGNTCARNLRLSLHGPSD